VEEGRDFNLNFKGGEWKQVLRVLDGLQRDQGFHLFCKDEKMQEKLGGLLQLRLASAMEDTIKSGQKNGEDILVAHHAIKVGLWSELEEHEREAWRNQAKSNNKAKTVPRVSEDRYEISHFLTKEL
jgi:hypothetical protein